MADGRPETDAGDISLCREKRYAIRPVNHRQEHIRDNLLQDQLRGPIMDKLPAQMTVIGISKPGGPEVLLPETRAVPVPGPGEILVKVHAAGVNRPDVSQRSGSYPPPPGASDLPGLEISGEVVALGPDVTKHKLGDKVMSLVAGGGYAQYCIAQDAQAMTVPPALSMLEAGATPETLMTVWHNVFERGALKPGETLLIHGGSSGIGTIATQLAKAFGSKVIVTVGSKEKADACVKLGADRAINYKTEDFVAEVKAATEGAGANVILDMVGGDYIERNYDAAAIDGRIVQIAFLGGPKATVNFAKLMVKRLHHTGSTLRPRSNADKAAMVTAIEAKVMPLLREGRIKPLMDSTFPLEKAADAHRRMETSEHIGKIVLAV
jgi:NADPH:quinone reductase